MGTKEFIHSRMVANAAEVSRLSSETSSNVNLYEKLAYSRVGPRWCYARWRVRCALEFLVQSEDKLREREAPSRVRFCVHRGDRG